MSLTRSVAEFIVHLPAAAIPSSVRALGTRSILDSLGLALAGSAAESGKLVQEYLSDLGCIGGASTVVGSGWCTAPRFAAFANGIAIHADDYDDTQLAVAPDRVYGLLTHPTAPVLPAVLAIAEHFDRTGSDLLDAYLIGTEVEMKISEAIGPRHYQDGFHSTGTIGTIGAAAGVARLFKFDVETTLRTLSIAASQSAGLRENFGTMTKPFHAGRAAENGVVSAEFAARGWTAAADILEAERGFFKAAGGGYDASFIDGKLGDPWNFDSPGVSIKPYPSGSLTHPAMCLMFELIRKHDIHPSQVLNVAVGTNANMPRALIHHRPRTGLNAKFSMEFCMAILLLERKAGLAEFTDEIVNRPDVQQMMQKVQFQVDPEAEAAGYDKMTSIIRVNLADGRSVEGVADYGKGSPVNPLTDGELEKKFYECAAWGRVSSSRAKAIADITWQLDSQVSVRQLTELLGQKDNTLDDLMSGVADDDRRTNVLRYESENVDK